MIEYCKCQPCEDFRARIAELEDALSLSREETACQEIGAIALRERASKHEKALSDIAINETRHPMPLCRESLQKIAIEALTEKGPYATND